MRSYEADLMKQISYVDVTISHEAGLEGQFDDLFRDFFRTVLRRDLWLCHPFAGPFLLWGVLGSHPDQQRTLFSQSSLELGRSSNIAWSFSLLFLSWSFTSFAKYVPAPRRFSYPIFGGEPNLRSCPLRTGKVGQVLETRIACHWLSTVEEHIIVFA